MTQHAAGSSADGGLRLTTLDGRYHILDRIAAGGMGEVFRARDAVLDREVAIKVLHRSLAGDQGFVERFRREARAAAGLSHPNIVAVYDWGAVDGIYYMVMEYVRGRAVRDLLNAQGRLAPAQAADVAPPDAARARARARPGHRAPRREAGEHPRHRRRHREGGRLRPRARVRRRPPDPGRHRHRHRPVPRARADPRRAGRPAQRPVLARHRRVRAADRTPAVHRRDGDGDRVQAPVRPGAAAEHAGAGPAGRGRRVRRQRHRTRPRAAARIGARDAARPGVDRARASAGPPARGTWSPRRDRS